MRDAQFGRNGKTQWSGCTSILTLLDAERAGLKTPQRMQSTGDAPGGKKTRLYVAILESPGHVITRWQTCTTFLSSSQPGRLALLVSNQTMLLMVSAG